MIEQSLMNEVFIRHRREVASLRVMVVDDQVSNTLLLEKILTSAGHIPLVFTDPESALDLLAIEDVDLLFLDVRMPGIDGITFLRHVRMMEAGRPTRVPAIFITGETSTTVREEAMAAGGLHVLAKPVRPNELLDVLTALFEEQAEEAAAAPREATESQVQLLRDARIGEGVVDVYVRLTLQDIAQQRQRLESSIFTRDRTAWLDACEEIRCHAMGIGVPAAAQLAFALKPLVSASTAVRLSGLRRLDAVLKRGGLELGGSEPDTSRD